MDIMYLCLTWTYSRSTQIILGKMFLLYIWVLESGRTLVGDILVVLRYYLINENLARTILYT